MGKPEDVLDTQYLQRRHQGWYVRIAVPQDLIAKAGKRHVLRSLKTRDLREARSRRHKVVADIMEQFDKLRGHETGDHIAAGMQWRAILANADDMPGDNPEQLSQKELLEDDMMMDVNDLETQGRKKEAYTLFRIATGKGAPIEKTWKKWITEISDRHGIQTINQHNYSLKLLKEALPSCTFTSDINRHRAGWFVIDYLK